jgi:membrane protein implicated in regulation of membrane protease activity
MSRFVAKGAKVMFRLMWRHVATLVIGCLSILALLTGYSMWKAGLPDGYLKLPWLVALLGSILAIVAYKRYGRRWVKATTKRVRNEVKKQVAKELVQRDKHRKAIDKGVEVAKEAVAGMTRKVKEESERMVSSLRADPPRVTPRLTQCPACHRQIQPGDAFCEGCGAEIAAYCSKCGARLCPGARFCEVCGFSVGWSG